MKSKRSNNAKSKTNLSDRTKGHSTVIRKKGGGWASEGASVGGRMRGWCRPDSHFHVLPFLLRLRLLLLLLHLVSCAIKRVSKGFSDFRRHLPSSCFYGFFFNTLAEGYLGFLFYFFFNKSFSSRLLQDVLFNPFVRVSVCPLVCRCILLLVFHVFDLKVFGNNSI